MRSRLVRVLDVVRAWLGLNDPSENRLHAAHGWLLPPVPVLVPVRVTPAPADARGAAKNHE
jgi:hypothetical protein